MKKQVILCSIVASVVLMVISLAACTAEVKPPEGQTAEWYYNEGLELGNSGRYEAAINYFNKAIELDPDYAEAYGDRAYVYYVLAEYGKAVNDWDECFRLKPEYGIDTVHAVLLIRTNSALAWQKEGLIEDVFFKSHIMTSNGETYKFAGIEAVVPAGTLDDESKTTALFERLNKDSFVFVGEDCLLITLCEHTGAGVFTSTQSKTQIISYSDREIPEDVIIAAAELPECP